MRHSKILKAAVIVICFAFIGMLELAGATFNVTTTSDHVAGSLREAIDKAMANNEEDTINLPAGVYYLTGAPEEDNNKNGDLDIKAIKKIVIVGDKNGNTIIDGSNNDRVIEIIEGTVYIQNVTIRNGKTVNGTKPGERGSNGAGIYNSGKLTLSKCTITKNLCGSGYSTSGMSKPGDGGDGGGIYNRGTLTVDACTIDENKAGRSGGGNNLSGSDPDMNGKAGRGGGIFNKGTMSVIKTTISNNVSGLGYKIGYSWDFHNDGGDGGGIYNSGKQTVANSTISYNTTGSGAESYVGDDVQTGRSGHGGGICNDGVTTLSNSVIQANYAGKFYPNNTTANRGCGGGLYNAGTLTLTQCSILENVSGRNGHGGGIYNTSTVTITFSTIENNISSDGYWDYYSVSDRTLGGHGGGIYNEETGTVTLTGCTVDKNKTGNGYNYFSSSSLAGHGGSGAGIFSLGILNIVNCTVSTNTTGKGGKNKDGGSGAGIFIGNGTVSIIDATICKNATAEGGSGGGAGWGGGMFISNRASTSIKNSIIADNDIPSGSIGPDIRGTFYSLGYNLVQNTTDCTITGILTGNILKKDPQLGELANNGGPTKTHAIDMDSPAVDAGNSPGISTDQRGDKRPTDANTIPNVGDGSDIGAYELQYTCSISGKVTYRGINLPDVTISLSNDGGTTKTDTEGKYILSISTGWTGTVTPSLSGYSFNPSNRSYSNITTPQTNQDFTAFSNVPPQIYLKPLLLRYTADDSGLQTCPQVFTISNTGQGVLMWTASADSGWIKISPSSGSGSGKVSVSVDPKGLSDGIYTGSVKVKDPDASNSPQSVTVILKVYKQGDSEKPFGSFDTPVDGSTVMGSIPLTGWALDDMNVEHVKVYRDPIEGEGTGRVFLGEAVMVDGARPDIELAYPGYPFNTKAGWGYMLLTYFLPGQGNGTFVLSADVVDKEGNTVKLGSKTIISDNAHAVKPFGAIDTPSQGGNASGTNYVNFGWTLTPMPNSIPTNGSTISVYVDGKPVGHPVYNQYRADIAGLFPGYANSNGATGYFYLDTSQYTDGVHTISWLVIDSGGNAEGIGSRFFNINNGSSSSTSISNSASTSHSITASSSPRKSPRFIQKKIDIQNETIDINNIFVDYSSPVKVKKGLDGDTQYSEFYPDQQGVVHVRLNQLERIEIRLNNENDPGLSDGKGYDLSGYSLVGEELRPLPVGSTLDSSRGVFYWQPGPGFTGRYSLVFILKTPDGQTIRKNIEIDMKPPDGNWNR